MDPLLIRILLWFFLVCRRTTNSLAYSNRCHNLVEAYDVSTRLSLSYCLTFNFESASYQILLHLYALVGIIQVPKNTLLSSLCPGRFCSFLLKMISSLPCPNTSFLFHPVMPFPVFLPLRVPISTEPAKLCNNYLLIFQY